MASITLGHINTGNREHFTCFETLPDIHIRKCVSRHGLNVVKEYFNNDKLQSLFDLDKEYLTVICDSIEEGNALEPPAPPSGPPVENLVVSKISAKTEEEEDPAVERIMALAKGMRSDAARLPSNGN